MKHLFPLLLALIAMPFRADARIEAKNPQLGYSFDVPIGFEEVAADKPGGPSGDTVQVFRHAAILKDPAGLTVSVKRLHSTLAQKPADASSGVQWKSRTLQMSRTLETLDGTACVTFGIQVPLAREAVQISISGPVPREQRLRQVAKFVLASLDGESNWPADATPPVAAAPAPAPALPAPAAPAVQPQAPKPVVAATPPPATPKPAAPAPAATASPKPKKQTMDVVNRDLGYFFKLPSSFREVTKDMPKDAKPNMVQTFVEEQPNRPPLFVVVERLHGTIGPESLPKGLKSSGGAVEVSDVPWPSNRFTLHMARVPEEMNGLKLTTFTVQVPLRYEAVQISVSSVPEAETSVRHLISDILGSLEGDAAYSGSTNAKPWWKRMEPEAFGKLCGYALVGVILIVVIAHKVFKKE